MITFEIWLKVKGSETYLNKTQFFTALKLIGIYQAYNSLEKAA